MAFKIVISEEAKTDIEHSYLYYQAKVNKRTADHFFKDVKDSLKSIPEDPYFKIRFKNFHGKPLKKYPFLIFYIVDGDEKTIIIARVFHTSQNPEKYP